MKIVLKVDDCWGTSSISLKNFSSFLDICFGYNLKIDLGIIGAGLSNKPEIFRDYFEERKDKIEIFNHSFNHNVEPPHNLECYGKPIEFQRDSIFKTQLAIAEKLGLICEVIGFPANAFDYNTIELLREFPLIKTIFAYSKGKLYNEIKVLGRKIVDISGYLKMEKPPKIVNLDDFKKEYNENQDCLVYQLHPANYCENDLKNFEDIIKFLTSRDNKFIFASEL